MQTLENKFINAIESGRLKLKVGTKNWYSYILEIQKLVWVRNLFDGFNIDVFDLENNFLETVKIEIKPVIEFGCVHNKMFLV